MNLVEEVRAAGVIGAGGAGFPTAAKIKGQAEFLIMNAAECEPLLRVDQQLMVYYADEILQGFQLVANHLNVKQAIIGIKEKHHEVIAHLTDRLSALKLQDRITIKPLRDVYPMGDEQMLVHEVTGRVVPEGGIPIAVGCVVMNSETALNVYRAHHGEPVVTTFLTVAGHVPKPYTAGVPVGTPLKEVLQAAGVVDFENIAVIDGGPMMGAVLKDFSGSVTKKSKGYVVLPKDHGLIQRKTVKMPQAKRINHGACEQCRMCTDLCPRYLMGHSIEPHRIMNGMTFAPKELEPLAISQLCCQCGVCELFACPANLYPKTANMIFKAKTLEANIRYQKTKEHFTPRPERRWRLLSSKRLMARLNILAYDGPAPLKTYDGSPSEVYLGLRQHIGAPAEATVQVGQTVRQGECIADVPSDALGAPVHASIDGYVASIDKGQIVIRRN